MNKFALVNLKGGLGNQIFQVSFANYLRSIGFYTFLDTSFYESNHTFPRKLEIDPTELGFKSIKLKSDLVFRLNNGLFWEDDTFEVNNLKVYNRFVGYYQNIKYLEKSKTFLKDKLNLVSTSFNDNVAAIHIRKTDYLIIDQALSDSYYKSAVDELLKKNSKLKFDIFTDDKSFNLDTKIFKNINNVYKPNSSEKSLDTLRKMLNYKFYITANSSFSSIAAFLSEGDNKFIIYPEPWWRNSEIKLMNVPPNWKSLNNK
jgi:hypothetical protein|tara:strand:+ start:18860 stop:19633 length:774 start_codon:yes stop_codon:yes gene_type:complete